MLVLVLFTILIYKTLSEKNLEECLLVESIGPLHFPTITFNKEVNPAVLLSNSTHIHQVESEAVQRSQTSCFGCIVRG